MMKKNVLAEKMVELRTSKNWTQQTMSTKLGIGYRTLRRYELNLTAKIPANIVDDYARIFNVTLDFLYYGVEFSDNEFNQALTRLSPKQRNAIKSVIESYK